MPLSVRASRPADRAKGPAVVIEVGSQQLSPARAAPRSSGATSVSALPVESERPVRPDAMHASGSIRHLEVHNVRDAIDVEPRAATSVATMPGKVLRGSPPRPTSAAAACGRRERRRHGCPCPTVARRRGLRRSSCGRKSARVPRLHGAARASHSTFSAFVTVESRADRLRRSTVPADLHELRVMEELACQLSTLRKASWPKTGASGVPPKSAQNALHIRPEPHVEHAIRFVEHEHLECREVGRLVSHVIHEAARCGDDHVHACAQRTLLRIHRHAAVHCDARKTRVVCQSLDLVFNLDRQFTRGREDKRPRGGLLQHRLEGSAAGSERGMPPFSRCRSRHTRSRPFRPWPVG